MPCLWLRGLVPKELTHIEEDHAPEPIREFSHYPDLDLDLEVFTDGSGGPNAKDPRLRICGWGLGVAEPNSVEPKHNFCWWVV